MRIGLYNLEPKIVNSALMQVAQYHKEQGDQVEHYNHLIHDDYDKIYAFSIFSWTPKHYITKDMICGGTGFDISSKLPPEIEACDYDWSMYPECEFSIIWFSRGCFRQCPFCIVKDKEGRIHPVKPKNLNPNGKYIKIMDNNFFGNPEWRSAIKQLQEWGQPVDFQGVDARILNKERCEALNTLKHYHTIKIAWDDPNTNLIPKLQNIVKYIHPRKLMCYVLIGYNTSQLDDLWRVEILREFNIDPYVCKYNPHDEYQKDFARWVNHKAIYRTVMWENYGRRHFEKAIRKEKPLEAY